MKRAILLSFLFSVSALAQPARNIFTTNTSPFVLTLVSNIAVSAITAHPTTSVTNAQPPSTTLSNLASQTSTVLNLGGGTNINGTNINANTVGTNTWTASAYAWVLSIAGGTNGVDGTNGLNGTSGTNGVNGAAGSSGTNGVSGFFGIATQVKPAFSTNYTVTTNDTVLFCSGTNQFITLSDVVATTGKYASVYPVSATASAIVTNSAGVTIMGAVSQMVTNGQHLTVISDGANWW